MKKTILIGALSVFCVAKGAAQIPDAVNTVLKKNACNSCHKLDKKGLAPSWEDIATKHYDKKTIIALIKEPKPSNWPGFTPMAALPNVPKADLGKIADWIVSLHKEDGK